MTSGIRRYKNQISIISKKLEAGFKKVPDFQSERIGYRAKRHSMTITVDKTMYEAVFNLILTFTKPKIKVVDSDDYIFMGLNLDQPVKVTFSRFKDPAECKQKAFMDAVVSDWSWVPPLPVAYEIQKELEDRGLLIKGLELKRSSPGIDAVTFSESEYYRDFSYSVDTMIAGMNINITLKKSEFPKCPDRNLFPYVFIDKEAGSVNYCIDSMATSYRQGRLSRPLGDFLADSGAIETAATRINPFNYLDIEVNHPHIQKVSHHVNN